MAYSSQNMQPYLTYVTSILAGIDELVLYHCLFSQWDEYGKDQLPLQFLIFGWV
jgi:hypothetical protein